MSSQEQIKIGSFKVFVVKSKRAKSVFLKQNTKGEIILTCPRFCPKMFAIRFAEGQIPWIRAHVQHGPKETVFHPGDTVTILGKSYILQHGTTTKITGKKLFISGDSEFFHRRVCSYAQKELLPYIREKVQYFAQKLDVKPGRITLRNTSSRWGSCSSTRNLSFCWKIAFAPKNVVDYLIAHEISHLIQMNHSNKFWTVVDGITNTRRPAEKWLKENGRFLQSIR